MINTRNNGLFSISITFRWYRSGHSLPGTPLRSVATRVRSAGASIAAATRSLSFTCFVTIVEERGEKIERRKEGEWMVRDKWEMGFKREDIGIIEDIIIHTCDASVNILSDSDRWLPSFTPIAYFIPGTDVPTACARHSPIVSAWLQ